MPSTSPLELAQKLKAMADKGAEQGERNNADKMLERHLEKHGISMDEVASDELKPREFKVTKEQLKFFAQIVSNVFGRGAKPKYNEKDGVLLIDLTNSDFIEISAKYEFFWATYLADAEEHRKLHYEAFIQKNELYVKGSDKIPPPMDLTEEEKEKIEKMRHIKGILNKHELQHKNNLKQLGE